MNPDAFGHNRVIPGIILIIVTNTHAEQWNFICFKEIITFQCLVRRRVSFQRCRQFYSFAFWFLMHIEANMLISSIPLYQCDSQKSCACNAIKFSPHLQIAFVMEQKLIALLSILHRTFNLSTNRTGQSCPVQYLNSQIFRSRNHKLTIGPDRTSDPRRDPAPRTSSRLFREPRRFWRNK